MIVITCSNVCFLLLSNCGIIHCTCCTSSDTLRCYLHFHIIKKRTYQNCCQFLGIFLSFIVNEAIAIFFHAISGYNVKWFIERKTQRDLVWL
ncbi:hypothetical protein CW304_24435 [Bacillus sp. UFRGS-B20]|nr:hypothetical protein CW304_24435 [Bacillus sp. UFRGS-B20]